MEKAFSKTTSYISYLATVNSLHAKIQATVSYQVAAGIYPCLRDAALNMLDQSSKTWAQGCTITYICSTDEWLFLHTAHDYTQ